MDNNVNSKIAIMLPKAAAVAVAVAAVTARLMSALALRL
jgi:hypothetical protein